MDVPKGVTSQPLTNDVRTVKGAKRVSRRLRRDRVLIPGLDLGYPGDSVG